MLVFRAKYSVAIRFLCQCIAISFQVLSVALDILHEQVLSREFVVIGKVVDNSGREGIVGSINRTLGYIIHSLVVVHSVATVTKDVPAGLRARPVKIPILIRRHLVPALLLKVIDQHRLVQIRAVKHLHPFRRRVHGQPTGRRVVNE